MERTVGPAGYEVEKRFNVVVCTGAFCFSADSTFGDPPPATTDHADWRQRLGRHWKLSHRVYANAFYPQFQNGWVHASGFHLSFDRE